MHLPGERHVYVTRNHDTGEVLEEHEIRVDNGTMEIDGKTFPIQDCRVRTPVRGIVKLSVPPDAPDYFIR